MFLTENKEKRNSILIKYTCIVTVICAVIFGALVSVYNIFENAILNELTGLNTSMTNQLDIIASNVQEFIKAYGQQIFYNPSIKELRSERNMETSDKLKALDELRSFSDTCSFIDSLHLYNEENGFIYSSKTEGFISTPKTFYDRGAARIFKEATAQDKLRPIKRTARYSPETAEQASYYSFLLFEPGVDKGGESGVLMLNIDPLWLNNLFLGETEGDSTLITDHNANVIATRKEQPYYELSAFWKYINGELEKGSMSGCVVYNDIHSEKMICLYSVMDQNNWIYMQTLPYSVCMKDVLKIRQDAFTVFFLLVAVFLIILVFLIYRVYFPFRKMVKSAAKISPDSGGEALETPEILDAFVEDSIKMKPRFLRATRELALLSLINSPTEDDAEKLSIKDGSALSLIMVLSSETDALYKTAQSEFFNVTAIYTDGASLIIIPDTDSDRVDEWCSHVMEETGNRIIKSPVISSFREVPEIYNNMLDASRLRIFLPSDKVVSVSEAEIKKTSVPIDEKLMGTLYSKLSSGLLDDAKNAYFSIINEASHSPYRDVIYILNSVNKICEKLILSEERSEASPFLPVKQAEDILNAFSQRDEMDAYYEGIFKEITSISRERQERKSNALCQSIKEQIELNFKNPTLNTREIASILNLSSSYITKQFKAFEGISVSDYINKVRLQNACRLLSETSLPIEEAASRSGFANTKYFYVLFKNETGKTPGQFRNSK